MSLIDFPGKISSVVFTQGCPFRCAYCHNPELLQPAKKGAIATEEILDYLSAHTIMLEGVCITGGEPTAQQDLVIFIEQIKKIGLKIKLDTNGTNPAVIETCIALGLVDYFAMDLKNAWDRYGLIVNSQNNEAATNCRRTFGIIQSCGVAHEFRTTVLPSVHDEKDFLEMASYLKEGEKYFIQNIRYKNNLDKNLDQSVKLDVSGMVSKLRAAYPKITVEER